MQIFSVTSLPLWTCACIRLLLSIPANVYRSVFSLVTTSQAYDTVLIIIYYYCGCCCEGHLEARVTLQEPSVTSSPPTVLPLPCSPLTLSSTFPLCLLPTSPTASSQPTSVSHSVVSPTSTSHPLQPPTTTVQFTVRNAPPLMLPTFTVGHCCFN